MTCVEILRSFVLEIDTQKPQIGFSMLRHELIEEIEITLLELKSSAEPRDLAKLRELQLDAEDAATDEELDAIEKEVVALRQFVESRKRSSTGPLRGFPPGRRRV